MRQFVIYYPDFEIVPQAVAQLPWGHISVLIHTIKDGIIRNWYAEKTLEEGWSRSTLEHNIKDNLYHRQAIPSTKTSVLYRY